MSKLKFLHLSISALCLALLPFSVKNLTLKMDCYGFPFSPDDADILQSCGNMVSFAVDFSLFLISLLLLASSLTLVSRMAKSTSTILASAVPIILALTLSVINFGY